MKRKIYIGFSIALTVGLLTFLLSTCNRSSEKELSEPFSGKVMDGFPATPESQVTLNNMFEPGYNHWGFRNAEVMPNLMVPRGGDIFFFPEKHEHRIENLLVSGTNKNVYEVLKADNTDGILVIKDSEIVYERYFGDFKPNNRHLWASSTKSIVGMSLGILVDEGKINLDEYIGHYLPELNESAFGKLNVQQVLNMVSALNFSEDYVDLVPGNLNYKYFRRMGFIPSYDLMALDPKESDIPRGNLELLKDFERDMNKRVGEVYEYHSPNVDVIGLLIQRVSGLPLNEFISEYIWEKIGAEHDAAIITDVAFNPIATGGMLSTLRDFAKFGYAVLNDGQLNGQQILPDWFIDNTYKLTEAEQKAGQNSVYRADPSHPAYDKYLEGYKNFWWILDSDKQVMMARGVYGQGLYIDKSKNIVIASFGSADSASNAVRDTHKDKLDAIVTIANFY